MLKFKSPFTSEPIVIHYGDFRACYPIFESMRDKSDLPEDAQSLIKVNDDSVLVVCETTSEIMEQFDEVERRIKLIEELKLGIIGVEDYKRLRYGVIREDSEEDQAN